jgi:hypothetical protein
MFKGLAGHLTEKNVHSINTLPSNNIELFDCYAGLILGHLYRNFPLPITLTAERFIDYKGLADSNREALEKEENLFLATVKWLADIGYIHFDGMSGVAFYEVVLTNSGAADPARLPRKAPTLRRPWAKNWRSASTTKTPPI